MPMNINNPKFLSIQNLNNTADFALELFWIVVKKLKTFQVTYRDNGLITRDSD